MKITKRHRPKPDPLIVEILWGMAMDTHAISSITGCRESDVYECLARVLELKNDQNRPDATAQCEQALEGDIGRESIQVF
jgi:hypothetical protein